VIGQLQDDGEPDAIRDAGQPDAISKAVGRAGYLSPYMEADLASDDGHEAAVFDRYSFPTGDEQAVFVDTVSAGLERARKEEAGRHQAQVVREAGRDVDGRR
jgi:hypothetical protein